MYEGLYNKTEISLSSIIIETANTPWPEATQRHYCGSTIKQRRYGRRSMAARMANIRRPIKRPRPPIAKNIQRRDELLSEVLFFASSSAHYPRTVSISASVISVNIVSGSRKVRAGGATWGKVRSNL